MAVSAIKPKGVQIWILFTHDRFYFINKTKFRLSAIWITKKLGSQV